MRQSNKQYLEEQLINLLLKDSDFFSAVLKVRKLLMDEFDLSDLEIVLKAEKNYRQIHTSHETPLIEDDPFYLRLSELPLDREQLSWQEDYPSFKKDIVYLIPLIVEKSLYGWVSFHYNKAGFVIDPEYQEQFQRLGMILTVGLRHLYTDYLLRERLEELTVVNHISKTMNSSLNVKETLESVMDAVITYTHPDRALMYLRDEEDDMFIPTLGRGMDDDISLDFKVDPEKSIFRHVITNKEPLIVNDITTDSRVNLEYSQNVRTKAFVVVPMISKEKVIGIIGVDNLHSDRLLHDIDVDLLVTLANHAAIALSNSRLHEKTQKFNEELKVRVKEATEHLERLVEMKSHFLTVASHQLRTPLTVVKGLLSMLAEDEYTAVERNEMIAKAFTSASRLERIISELLTATELEDAPAKKHEDIIDPANIIQEIVTEYSSLAAERNIELIINVPAEHDLCLKTDRFKLYEAIANLVDNAIRYTESGSVTVSIDHDNSFLTLEVADTGIGIDPDQMEKIFTKFHRSERGLEHEPHGSGLGLFIAKRIIENMKGHIIVNSKGKSQGTTFTITLPLHIIKKKG